MVRSVLTFAGWVVLFPDRKLYLGQGRKGVRISEIFRRYRVEASYTHTRVSG